MTDIIKLDMTNIWASSGDKTDPGATKIATGWVVEAVPRQTWNWFENRQDTNIAYMLQKGIPEWDATTQYQTNKSYVQRNNVIYKCIQVGTNQDPATAPLYWVKAFTESTASSEALKVLTPATDTLPYFTSSSAAATTAFTSFARTLLAGGDAPTMRTTLSAQTLNANLTALAGVTAATNMLPYFNSTTTQTTTALTAYGRSLIGVADAPTARTTLGLGTVAVANLTTSSTDTTSGSVLKVGDFGLGGTITIADSTDLNTITASGFYRLPSTGTNMPSGAAYGSMIVCRSADTIAQIAIGYTGSIYYRAGNPTNTGGTGSYTAWNPFYSTQNTSANVQAILSAADYNAIRVLLGLNNKANAGANSDITSLSGLTTALSVAQGGTGVTTSTGSGSNVLSVSPALTGSPTVPTQAVSDNSTKVASTAYVSNQIANFAGSLVSGAKNRIINGDCRIAQRGSSFAVPNNTSGYGGPDRYYAANTAAGGQFTQSWSTLVDGSVTKNCVTQTVNTVAADLTGTKLWTGVVQYIEGFNCYDLIGQATTLSFLFKGSIGGTYSVAVRDSTASYSYITTFTATGGVVQRVILNIPAIPSSASLPNTSGAGLSIWIGAQNNGSYATSTTNAWQNASYICATPVTFWSVQSGATISVTDLQFEIGTAATSFEHRSYSHELMLCQRYYEVGYQPLSFLGGALTGIATAYGDCVYTVAKRVAPATVALTSWQYYSGGTATAMTPNVILANTVKFGFSVTGATNWNGWAGNGTWAASSEL